MSLHRFVLILRHPIRWACGACFICGELMLWDEPNLIGNRNGFCFHHGFAGNGRFKVTR